MFISSPAGINVGSSLFFGVYIVFKSKSNNKNEYRITCLKMWCTHASTCLELYWRGENATTCNLIVIFIIMALSHLSDT